MLGNGGIHSNGAQKHTTRSWYEPGTTSQVSSKPVDSSGLQSCPLHTNKQTDGKPENKGSLATTQKPENKGSLAPNRGRERERETERGRERDSERERDRERQRQR